MFSFFNSFLNGQRQAEIQPSQHAPNSNNDRNGTHELKLVVRTAPFKNIVSTVDYFPTPNPQTFGIKMPGKTIKWFDCDRQKTITVVCAGRFFTLEELIEIPGIEWSQVQRIAISRAQNYVSCVIFPHGPDTWKMAVFEDVKSLDAKTKDIRTLTPGNTYDCGHYKLLVNPQGRAERQKCKKRKRPENNAEFSDDENEETKEENNTSRAIEESDKELMATKAENDMLRAENAKYRKALEHVKIICRVCCDSDTRDLRKAFLLKCGCALCHTCFWKVKTGKNPRCPFCRHVPLEFATLQDGINACVDHMCDATYITEGQTREAVEKAREQRKKKRRLA